MIQHSIQWHNSRSACGGIHVYNTVSSVQPTIVIKEVIGKIRMHHFFFQKVFLIEEEDDGGVEEPWVAYDGLKETKTLHHTIYFLNERGREGGRRRGGKEGRREGERRERQTNGGRRKKGEERGRDAGREGRRE